MRRAIKRAVLVLSMIIVPAILSPVGAASAATPGMAANAGYLENVTFEKLAGKERVALAVTKLAGVTVENQPGNAVWVRMENTSVPEGLQHPLIDPSMSNIIRVTPVQKAADGRSWVIAQIDLKKKVPYSVRQEGLNILIDFNVTSLPSTGEPVLAMVIPGAVVESVQPVPSAETAKAGAEKRYDGGPRIFLDVQEADIKAVFRLLAEQGKVSIVSGDDVKGNVTLHMKDVPWEQAFRTILDLKGLDQRREGDIITVVTLDRKKKEEAERLAVEAALVKAEDERKIREQKLNVEQGRLKQIVIEAKIVEVTTNFARELGVRWGAGYQGSVGGVDYGVGFGNSGTGTLTPLGAGIGLTGSSVAVNFPSAATLTTPALGLVLGTSRLILDARLSALETTGDGKIISSPKVTTLENEKATIWQGKRIPVVTPATNTSPATVRYEDADLRLVVTPKITPKQNPGDEDRMSLEIEATNKDVDPTLSVLGNPAINNSGVTAKVVIRDGDTIVVGGIYKTTENLGKDGVPFFADIPFLGWLFKTETKSSTTREILIFITPQIVKTAS